MRYQELLESLKSTPEFTVTETNTDKEIVFTQLKNRIVSFQMFNDYAYAHIWESSTVFNLFNPNQVHDLLVKLNIREDLQVKGSQS